MIWTDFDFNNIKGVAVEMGMDSQGIDRPGTDGVAFVLVGQNPHPFAVRTHLLSDTAITAAAQAKLMRSMKNTLQTIVDGLGLSYDSVQIQDVITSEFAVGAWQAAYGYEPPTQAAFMVVATWTMVLTIVNSDIV